MRPFYHIFMGSAEHHNSMDVCRRKGAGQLITWLKKLAKKQFLLQESKVLNSHRVPSMPQSILWTEHMSAHIRCLPSRWCVCAFPLRNYSTLVCKNCVTWHRRPPVNSSGGEVCPYLFFSMWTIVRGGDILSILRGWGQQMDRWFGQMLTST